MAFKDLGDWAELGALRLPISGKTYVIPSVDAELGPKLQALFAAGLDAFSGKTPSDADVKLLDDDGEVSLYQQVLGPAYAEMVADAVPWAALKHAAMTAILDATASREMAEQFWSTLGKPPRKKPADRTPKRDPKVTEIRMRRASTAGTTSRKRTATKRATPGRTSSSAGG